MKIAAVLAAKELRELAASRAFWLLLLLSGPLAGQAASRSLQVYLEASGTADSAGALPEVLQPLGAFLAPLFGPFALLSALLFPFVAIRLVSPEKLSGGLELLSQTRASLPLQIAVKAAVLLVAGALAILAPLALCGLYLASGGQLSATEAVNLLLGHTLHFSLCAAIGLAAGAVARDSSSAALVALATTLGTWALDFWSQGRSGVIADAASLTPAHLLSAFERGELPLAGSLAALLVLLSLALVVRTFLQPGIPVRRLVTGVLVAMLPALCGLAMPLLFQASGWTSKLDRTADGRLSFPEEEEKILRSLGNRLRITVNLAPEDPRLFDLEHEFVGKLRRAAPKVRLEYHSGSETGLFEAASENYGTIVYELDGKRRTSRSTIEAVILGEIFALASVSPPPRRASSPGGHKLSRIPKGITFTAFAFWPAGVAGAFFLSRRSRRTQ